MSTFILYRKHLRKGMHYSWEKPEVRPKDLLFFDNAFGFAEWTSALSKEMLKYFDISINVVTYDGDEDELDCEIDGVKFLGITKSKIKGLLKGCDVFLLRGVMNEIRPPQGPISIFYPAAAGIVPRYPGWNIILNAEAVQPGQLVEGNIYSWVKGLNSNVWHTSFSSLKKYDFVTVGRTGKDFSLFERLAKAYPQMKFAMVGEWAQKPQGKNIDHLGFLRFTEVRKVLSESRWAIMSPMGRQEGFPTQTQLEYGLMGLKHIRPRYLVPNYYINEFTSCLSEKILFASNSDDEFRRVRCFAEEHFTSERSAVVLMDILSTYIG